MNVQLLAIEYNFQLIISNHAPGNYTWLPHEHNSGAKYANNTPRTIRSVYVRYRDLTAQLSSNRHSFTPTIIQFELNHRSDRLAGLVPARFGWAPSLHLRQSASGESHTFRASTHGWLEIASRARSISCRMISRSAQLSGRPLCVKSRNEHQANRGERAMLVEFIDLVGWVASSHLLRVGVGMDSGMGSVWKSRWVEE